LAGSVVPAEVALFESPRAIVISDLHLNSEAREQTSSAFEALLARHPRAELVLNGDVFELSAFPASDPPARVFQHILSRHPRFGAALGAHLARGAAVTFVAGNHDAALTEISDTVSSTFRHGDRNASVVPWFLRRGHVHIEHGHVFDPDNAPLHPLADFASETEPLGAALMRRFIARSGAKAFAHAHETTPVQGIQRAFRLYGARAPSMIACYFQQALGLCWEASRGRAQQREVAFVQGQGRLDDVAQRQALSTDVIRALLSIAPVPTHAHFWPLFRRLYFDSVVAGLAGTGALAGVVTRGGPAALFVLLASGGYLVEQSPRGRYAGRPCRDLEAGALDIARVTGASRVVFGHTHVEADDGPYLNPGSFTYTPGRPCYALLLDDTRAEVARL
jgi:UDP-2,3-diacylglucosamine pyrophosphatase LpxH